MKTLLLLALIFAANFSISQTIEISGNRLTFGKSFDEVKGNLWSNGGQIESDYSYIEFYECNGQVDCINGAFYKNTLAAVYISAHDNNSYPVSKDVENLLTGLEPFKEYTDFEDIGTDVQLYKTSDYYISRSSSRMNTDYIIIPIDILNNIQKQHPEYLKKFIDK